jgi:hypothetical protein
MIYEIANPSDACTIEADDSVLAAIAVLILSNGAYGLYDEDGRTVLPIFAFSGPERLIEWLKDHGIEDGKIDEFYAKNGDEMAKILESVAYGKIDDRKGITALTDKMSAADRLEALSKWNESRRSSVTDISAACLGLAKVFREKATGNG